MGFDRRGVADRRRRAPVRDRASAPATCGSPPAGMRVLLPTGLYGAMHECGHGLYEAGIAPSLMRTPPGRGRVAGGARVPEPAVGEHGRARSPVLRLCSPPGSAELAGGRLAGLDPDRAVRAVNRVKPVVHPRRGRRGHLRAAHHPALRARAAADRRHADRRRSPRGMEHPLSGVLRDRGPRRRRTASCRTSTGRRD